MRRFLIIVLAVIATSCLKNDLSYPYEQAGFVSFEIEGQLKSAIYNNDDNDLRVLVTLPEGTDAKGLIIKNVVFTEGAEIVSGPALEEGGTIDLSDTLNITLRRYADFDWKIIAVYAEEDVKEGPQLYNMNFDEWTLSDNQWWLYSPSASSDEMATWGTSNGGTAIVNTYNVMPEEEFVVSGKAAKITSISIKILFFDKFAAGSLFTGSYGKTVGTSGADLYWGVPFNGRPKSLKGYYCYHPGTINYSDDDHTSMKGQTDYGQIQVLLTDWPEQFVVQNYNKIFVDIENDDNIIAYNDWVFQEDTGDSYKEFNLELTYKSERTPTMAVIAMASSRYGDYFTGSSESVLYVDEFEFIY